MPIKGGRPSGGRSFGSGGSKGSRSSSLSRPTSSSNVSKVSSTKSTAPAPKPAATHLAPRRRRFWGPRVVIIGGGGSARNTGNAAQPGQPAAPVQQQPPQFVNCLHCGTQRKYGETKCPSCGSSEVKPFETQQGTYDAQSGTYAAPKKSNKGKVIAIIASVLIVLIAIIILVSIFGSKTHTGYVGDTQKTAWFEFTVDDAVWEVTYNGYTVANGKEAMIIDITIKNTTDETLTMFDNDFVFFCKRYAAETSYEPVTKGAADFILAFDSNAAYPMFNFVNGKYDLTAGETIKGRLVFVFDNDAKDGTFNYAEYNENGKKKADYNIKIFWNQ